MSQSLGAQIGNPPSDDRRQDFRADVSLCLSVDLQMALSYQSVDPLEAEAAQWQWDDLAVSPDLVKTMVSQTELPTQEPLLLQMLVRVDWMLTSVLKTLGKDKTLHRALPEFLTANLSGSGIRFPSKTEFQVGDHLVLRMVLRPFVPIQAVGRVLRVRPVTVDDEPRWETACEFMRIASDDREAIIRHVLRSQAVLQRRRNTTAVGSLP